MPLIPPGRAKHLQRYEGREARVKIYENYYVKIGEENKAKNLRYGEHYFLTIETHSQNKGSQINKYSYDIPLANF